MTPRGANYPGRAFGWRKFVTSLLGHGDSDGTPVTKPCSSSSSSISIDRLSSDHVQSKLSVEEKPGRKAKFNRKRPVKGGLNALSEAIADLQDKIGGLTQARKEKEAELAQIDHDRQLLVEQELTVGLQDGAPGRFTNRLGTFAQPHPDCPGPNGTLAERLASGVKQLSRQVKSIYRGDPLRMVDPTSTDADGVRSFREFEECDSPVVSLSFRPASTLMGLLVVASLIWPTSVWIITAVSHVSPTFALWLFVFLIGNACVSAVYIHKHGAVVRTYERTADEVQVWDEKKWKPPANRGTKDDDKPVNVVFVKTTHFVEDRRPVLQRLLSWVVPDMPFFALVQAPNVMRILDSKKVIVVSVRAFAHLVSVCQVVGGLTFDELVTKCKRELKDYQELELSTMLRRARGQVSDARAETAELAADWIWSRTAAIEPPDFQASAVALAH